MNNNSNKVCLGLPIGFCVIAAMCSYAFYAHSINNTEKRKGIGTKRHVKSGEIKDLGDFFDHTQLKADSTLEQIQQLCDEAMKYNFASVCINSTHVPYVFEYFKEHGNENQVRICSVIGFPLGAMSTEAKIAEVNYCIEHGANEIDMVIQVGLLKSNDLENVYKDIDGVVKACHNHPNGYTICKVILETCLLTNDEIQSVSHLCGKSGADYIKTSTGFSTSGASANIVHQMAGVASKYPRKNLAQNQCGPSDSVRTMQVKASGGIRNGIAAMKMIRAGLIDGKWLTTRLGTSATVKILNDWVDMGIQTVEQLHRYIETHPDLDLLNHAVSDNVY